MQIVRSTIREKKFNITLAFEEREAIDILCDDPSPVKEKVLKMLADAFRVQLMYRE